MATVVRDVIDDTRVVLRTLKRAPGFVTIAVVVLALGFGVTGAVFSTVNGWLAVDKAIPNAEHLVSVSPRETGVASPGAYFRELSYTRLFERRLRTITGLFATLPAHVVLSFNDLSVNARMESVTGAYFRSVGVAPLVGRTLGPDDDRPGNGLPVVLGEGAWRRLFAADPGVIGRPIRVSGLLGTIVGVMPASVHGFTVPTNTIVDVWTPMAAARSLLVHSDQALQAQVFGRLVEGASFRQAEAELRVAGVGFDPDSPRLGASLFPVERGVMPARVLLGLRVAGSGLVALSSLVLLIACANLANLLLARSAARSSEVAIRMALGASPSRIVRLQLLETGCITAVGGAAGFVLVIWASRVVGEFTLPMSGGGVAAGRLLVDAWLLVFFFVLVASASVAIGVLPAMRAVRIDPGQVLAWSGSRGHATGRFERNRTLLVASQVAASTVLLVVAGLFVQSARHASRYDVAFDASHLVIGHLNFSGQPWDEREGLARQDRLLTVARSMAGVRAAVVTTALPAGGGGELAAIEAEDSDLGKGEYGPPCRCVSASPGLFNVLGPLPVRGRDFLNADRKGERGVAVVNDTAASLLWPGRNPIGRRLRIRKGDPLEVVGVVADTDHTAQDPPDRVLRLLADGAALRAVLRARGLGHLLLGFSVASVGFHPGARNARRGDVRRQHGRGAPQPGRNDVALSRSGSGDPRRDWSHHRRRGAVRRHGLRRWPSSVRVRRA